MFEVANEQPQDHLPHDLPDFSGLRLLIRLVPRPRYPKTSVIVLSDNPIPGMAVLARNNGAQAYIMVKSDVTGNELEAAIDKSIVTVSATRQRSSS